MIQPLERMGHSPVVVCNKRGDLLLEVVKRAKVPTLEEFTYQNAESDLDLVHPGSMLGSIEEDDLVCRIVEKSRACGH